MGWSYLLVAIALEIAWASTLKWTDGYTRPGPSLVNLVLCLAKIGCMALILLGATGLKAFSPG